MTLKVYILFLSMLFIGCNFKNSEEQSVCKKKSKEIKDTLFTQTDILCGFEYNDSCYINTIKFVFKIDKRSGKMPDKGQLSKVILDIGYIDEDSKKNKIFPNKSVEYFDYNVKKATVSGVIKIDKLIDSINYIMATTLIKDSLEKKTYFSKPYAFKKSFSLIEMENSYLDFKAFRNTNTKFKNISTDSNIVDSILVTAKSNIKIDTITKYHIKINDTVNLNFKNSIKANFKEFKLTDKKVKMYNLLKMDKEFVTFKLDFSDSNIKSIKSFELSLN